jgi:mono/diheme cytochrome c family protein
MRATLTWAFVMLSLGGCSPRSEDAASPPPVQFQSISADVTSHGRRLALILGCIGCHGDELTGEDWSEPGFGRLWTANLTRSVPRYSDARLAEVIRSGRRPDRALWEMPSHLFTQLTADDMAAVIAFLRSRPPTGAERPAPLFEEEARAEIATGTFKSSRAQVVESGARWPPGAGEDHALGRYIVRATCAECHGLDLRGGQPNPQAATRPDIRMMAAAYEPGQFRRLLRDGIAAGDRPLGLMGQVARGRYRHLTDAEVSAVHNYLRAVAQAAP